MKNIKSTAELKEAIQRLEIQQLEETRRMKEEFHLLYESLQPVNMIKNSLHKTLSMPGLKENVLKPMIASISGFFRNFNSKHPEGVTMAFVNGIRSTLNRIKSRNSSKNAESKLYYDIE